jgi:hypothetical protein
VGFAVGWKGARPVGGHIHLQPGGGCRRVLFSVGDVPGNFING